MDALDPFVAVGIPIVGLEPSCILTFRDELPSLFPRRSSREGDCVERRFCSTSFWRAKRRTSRRLSCGSGLSCRDIAIRRRWRELAARSRCYRVRRARNSKCSTRDVAGWRARSATTAIISKFRNDWRARSDSRNRQSAARRDHRRRRVFVPLTDSPFLPDAPPDASGGSPEPTVRLISSGCARFPSLRKQKCDLDSLSLRSFQRHSFSRDRAHGRSMRLYRRVVVRIVLDRRVRADCRGGDAQRPDALRMRDHPGIHAASTADCDVGGDSQRARGRPLHPRPRNLDPEYRRAMDGRAVQQAGHADARNGRGAARDLQGREGHDDGREGQDGRLPA